MPIKLQFLSEIILDLFYHFKREMSILKTNMHSVSTSVDVKCGVTSDACQQSYIFQFVTLK